MGTRFLATEESGANDAFKQAIVDATTMDDIELYNSNAMLPARGLRSSGVFHRIDKKMSHVRACVENCLVQCAYRDGVGMNAE
jgi:NAD(P)H-dependent flavin oxidoreductase YrpB (nitropropane dioxygenase family)